MSPYRRSEETRRALIEAAGSLVARQGVEGTGTREIAARAGQNIGSIHYHFGGKEGLLLATVGYASRRLESDPLGGYLESHLGSARNASELAAVVAGFISLNCHLVFSEERADWGPAFCFQAIQHSGVLRDAVLSRVVDRLVRAHVRLYRFVRPSASEESAWPWAYSMVAQVTFFAAFEPALLPYMNWESYPRSFIEETRLRLIDNALRSLDLPGNGND